MMEKMTALIGEIKAKIEELESLAMNKEMPEYEDEGEDDDMPEMDMKKAAFIAKMKKDMMG